MLKNKILLSSPHMGGGEKKYIDKAFKDNWIAPLGENVDGFESDLADFSGSVGGASVVTSGTAAIHLGLSLLGVGKDDIVFAPSFTFVASVNPIVYQGAVPVFIDSEPETWNMSPKALERALLEAKKNNKLPKAIIVVNLYGQMAKYDEILNLAEKYAVPVLEDAAESLGSVYKGRKSGTLGTIGIFSFNGNKIITTSGGGALISSDKTIVDRSRFLATQAKDAAPYYQHSTIGYNYRLSNVLAGIGRGQMEVLPQRIERRREIFANYEEAFKELDVIDMMPELDGFYSNHWLSTLTITSIDKIEDIVSLINQLDQKGIEARALWKPMHLQPEFENIKMYNHNESEMAVCEKIFNQGLCLPSGSNMTEDEQKYVIDELKQIIEGNS